MAFERMKESAKRGLATSRARVDETRAQRQRDKLLYELGRTSYAEHAGHATPEAVASKMRALDDFEQSLREKQEWQARDIMHPGAECVDEDETVASAARKMRDLGVGSLPICGVDDRLHGIITDRDIVVRCIAEGQEPGKVKVRDLTRGELVWVDADAGVNEVLHRMEDHQVKRLPVIENHRLVGMISESDLARSLDERRLAEFVGKVYTTS
ncbi:CBS domain-containing protein [Dactylosporangium sp. AC04546]|uniref:CBS domain-containing protein n=1 Tax=Dactylosporangium sp. AC04546 TaxID=2862460 RepID=UPI001EDFFEBE|nr:CBS domain-containing protein [Dactylosporangium sp. AC04546]WVK84143.1 CBS domain-containing protein [Dactylosporangium sp. AC04546]